MKKVIIENTAEDNVELASLKRIFFARVIDLIISLVPGIILSLIYQAYNWKSAVIVVSSSFLILFSYFILLAYFCKGNTLGKLMLGVKVVHKDKSKIKFYEVFFRELYHTLIPWIVQLLCNISIVLIAQNLNADNKSRTVSTICFVLQNISVLFYMLWFIYIGVTIYGQEDHQSSIDYKFKIVCVYKTYEKVIDVEEGTKVNVHLADNLPGKINITELNKILEENNDNDQ